MENGIKFPKNATVAMIKSASIGKSFIFDGHRTSANSPFFKAGLKFSTNQAWVVLMGKTNPIPVTIITITGEK